MRLVVVDFLATLFVTFCIGVATAIVLAACVMLVASDARGAAPAKPAAQAAATRSAPAAVEDLLLAHYFAAKYASLLAVDRLYAPEPREDAARAKKCRG
jgi:MFS superfamily sulfate permease-like transporter